MAHMPDPSDQSDPDKEVPLETVYLSSSSKPKGEPKKKKVRKKKEDPRVGTSLGKYQGVGVLGRGGMGVVYQAYDPIIDRRVAIKLLPQEVAEEDDEAFRRLLLEAQTAGRLNHQNTVAVYDAGLAGDTYYVVLELVTGGNVLERLVKKRYTWIEATKVLADACRGVAAAHAKDMIHRDIKPANLMFTASGEVKVADFGLASAPDLVGASLSNAGDILGTPHYMSPEQCESKPVDQRTDIYSLGATYYTLLTSERPFDDAETAMQVMYSHVHQEPPDPRDLDDTIPQGCKDLIAKAMAKAPADRYQTCEEVLDALNALLAASETKCSVAEPTMRLSAEKAKRVLQAKPADKSGDSMRRWILGIGALVVLAGLGLWIAFGGSGRNNKQNQPAAGGPAKPPIKVGILHSLSGTLSTSESPVVDATLLAIEEINNRGGIDGRIIQPTTLDGKSASASFAAAAEELISKHGVSTIFGCWTSASRKAVRDVVEKHDHLLVYPVAYEGLEQSPSIFSVGAAPNQQLLPAVTWCVQERQLKRVFLVGTDSVYSRAAHAIIKDRLKQLGGSVVGELVRKLGATDFEQIINAIATASPDVILNTISGDSNVSFFRALRAYSFKDPKRIPAVSFRLDRNLARSLDPASIQGDFVAGNYFQSINSDLNRSFLAALHRKFGPNRPVTDTMASAYCAVNLWAQAVRDAGSTDVKQLRAALRNQSFVGPGGGVRIDSETQHSWRTFRMAEFDGDGKLKVIFAGSQPIPYPGTRSTSDWKNFLHDLHTKWQSRWER